MSPKTPTGDVVRLDQWLWAARMFKTRALAARAVDGGKVHVNGERVKAGKRIRGGEVLRITRGHEQWTMVVRALQTRRGPASEAVLLYEETAESRQRRAHEREARRLAANASPRPARRPDKKERKTLRRLGGKE